MSTHLELWSQISLKTRNLSEEDLQWVLEKIEKDLPKEKKRHAEYEEEKNTPQFLTEDCEKLSPAYLALVEKIVTDPDKISNGFRFYQVLGSLVCRKDKAHGAIQDLGQDLLKKGHLQDDARVKYFVEELGFYSKELLDAVVAGDYETATLHMVLEAAPREEVRSKLAELQKEAQKHWEKDSGDLSVEELQKIEKTHSIEDFLRYY